MFKHLGWATLAGIVLFAALGAPGQAKEAKKLKVLIIDGQNNHNWRATTPVMKKALEDSGRFTVDVATSPERLDQPNAPQRPKNENDEAAQAKYKEAMVKYIQAMIKYKEQLPKYKEAMENFQPDLTKYDVVLSNYNGHPWSKKLQQSLDEYVKSGKGGLVIVHAANNSFSGWTEYDRMIGMGWRGNNYGDRLTIDADGKEVRVPKGKGPGAGHGAQHAFLVTVRDRQHPITKDMPEEWLHAQDELYHGMRGPVENVHLLATAFDDKSKGGTGEHEPMIWTVKYGEGRVFHTPMGHDLPGMRCIGFITTLQRGTEWAATGRVTIPIPANFPTAKQTSSVPAK
jgi:type 1 glutamine amidotransferase